jgi:type I restriction enzyme S subunit
MDKIPKDWKVVKLEYICEVNGGDTAPQEKEYFENGEIPFVRMQHLNNLEENKYVKNFDLISKKAVIDKKMKIFKKGSILLAKSGESIRTEKKAILKFDSCVVNHLAVLTIKDETKVDNEYLFYFFKKFMLSSLLTQTTTPSINLSVFRKLKIFLPPLREQKAIAQILSTIDKAIQKVDEIITKTERLKKGLMQKLLTKGIGHKEFKDTEIGRIPKEWEVVRVGEIMGFVKGKKPEEVTDEYKENYLPYLSTEYLRENKATKFVKNPNDVVLADDGDLILLWDGSNAGEFFLGRRGVLSSTMVKIKLREKNYDQKFLFYLLKTKENYLKEQTRGTGIPHVDGSVLSSLKIPIPPLAEQQKIAEILSTIDKKLELEKKRKEKLERIKEGLMDLLLTGKLRVKV